MALKMRLEQMNDAEERILDTLRKERAEIFTRLRELDSKLETDSSYESLPQIESNRVSQQPDITQQISPSTARRKGFPSRRSKTMKMRNIAIECLKEVGAPVRGADLQKRIEERADNRITNMTTFMSALQKTDENIIKLGRGLYTYRNNPENEISYVDQTTDHSNNLI